MNDIPVNKLGELYQLVHSMSSSTKPKENLRKKILAFGGAFSDMSNEDYEDFLNHTKQTRVKLFDRSIDL